MWYAGLDQDQHHDEYVDTELSAKLRHLSMEEFLDRAFGAGRWVYDAVENLYVASHPKVPKGYAVTLPDRSIHWREMSAGEIH